MAMVLFRIGTGTGLASQSNIFTHEGVIGDRHWWIICLGVGGSCSFIKPFQEYLGTGSPFYLTLLSLFLVAHMIIAHMCIGISENKMANFMSSETLHTSQACTDASA
jgi:hypothetical protein